MGADNGGVAAPPANTHKYMDRLVLIALLVAGLGLMAAVALEILYQLDLANTINHYGATHVVPPNLAGGTFCAYAFRNRSGSNTLGNQWLLAGPTVSLCFFGVACLIVGLVARSRRRTGARFAIAAGVVETVLGVGAFLASGIWVSIMVLSCMD